VEGAAGFAGCVDRNENVDLTHPAPGTIVATLQDSYHNHYNHHNHALDCTVVGCLRLVGGVLGVASISDGRGYIPADQRRPECKVYHYVTLCPQSDAWKCIETIHFAVNVRKNLTLTRFA
jgi:hypothetical protein